MIVTIAEAAARLGISENAVRQRVKRGTIAATKVAGRWRIDIDQPTDQTADQPTYKAAKEKTSPDSNLSALVKAKDEEIARLVAQLEAKDRQIEAKDRQIEGALTISLAQRALEAPKAPWWERLIGKG